MTKGKYSIGVDASGGDFAPQAIVKGVILAKKDTKQEVTLIGSCKEIEKEILHNKANPEEFTLVDAPERIEMGEAPATSVRKKRKSSIAIGAKLLKEKKINAFVSCGNTGAMVCAASLNLGLIEGIERPGIGFLMPTLRGVSLIIDAGANIDSKPIQLLQYGAMSSVYSEFVLRKSNPTVGLLNIGEEESKGSEFVKNSYKLFSASPLNFIGNIEPKDIFAGKCDCVICDGFVGNITLKVAEGTADFVRNSFINIIKKDFWAKLGMIFLSKSLTEFKKKFYYAEYGGAPLLGIDGIVIIGHGRSNALAVKNAVGVAAHQLSQDLNSNIKRRVNEICQDSGIREILTA